MLRTRIAPTPSGYLHIGNAFSFVLTALLCHRQKGELRLRIDDLDEQRKRPEYVEDIFYSLDWLGIFWQAGPSGPEDFEANFSQRHRMDLYEGHLEQLWAQGKLYACSCSRKDLQEQHERGIANCPCRKSPLNEEAEQAPVAWRLPTPMSLHVAWEDAYMGGKSIQPAVGTPNFVVRKKDGFPAYQLTSLVDDWTYGTNCIVRGEDLLASTAAQLYLAEHLSFSAFSSVRFVHHPLLVDPNGDKLSKSRGSRSLSKIRAQHSSPELLYRYFSRLLRLPRSAKNFREMIDLFPLRYPLKER